jgi:hypothetical protein
MARQRAVQGVLGTRLTCSRTSMRLTAAQPGGGRAAVSRWRHVGLQRLVEHTSGGRRLSALTGVSADGEQRILPIRRLTWADAGGGVEGRRVTTARAPAYRGRLSAVGVTSNNLGVRVGRGWPGWRAGRGWPGCVARPGRRGWPELPGASGPVRDAGSATCGRWRSRSPVRAGGRASRAGRGRGCGLRGGDGTPAARGRPFVSPAVETRKFAITEGAMGRTSVSRLRIGRSGPESKATAS